MYTLDFSPDGSMLASGGADSCLRVWNTRTSQAPATRGNTGELCGLGASAMLTRGRFVSDVNDPKVNPDYVGRWHCGGGIVHTAKFEATNLLHCVVGD